MTDENAKLKIVKIPIKELPQTASINDDDIFIESNTLETYRVTALNIAKYISENKNLTNKYVEKAFIGVANGIAPLNGNEKINGEYLTYGNTANTAYEGNSGKILEQNLDNHLTDDNAHGLGNVDNTSDMDKPVSTAQQEAINNALIKAKDYTNQIKSDIMGGLPDETLDTITELGEKLKDESDALNVLVDSLGNKVDKVDGKHLSTNDYSTEEKTKLTGIEENANNYILPSATPTVLGGVKIGNNISNSDGTISLTKKNVTDALGYIPSTGQGTAIQYELTKKNGEIKLIGNDGSETSIPDSDTTYSVFVGATSASDGNSGLVPSPLSADRNKFLKGDGTFSTPPDTKNTAGSTNTEEKIFLIGAQSQTNASVTYSNTANYIGADGLLYSNDTKVSLDGHTHDDYISEVTSDTEPTNQRVGDYWLLEY